MSVTCGIPNNYPHFGDFCLLLIFYHPLFGQKLHRRVEATDAVRSPQGGGKETEWAYTAATNT